MSSSSEGAASAAPNLKELARQIREELAGIKEDNRSALEHAIAAGEKLNQAKARRPHSKWLPWLRENFDLSVDMANKYMRLARNSERVLNLGSIREALAALPKKQRKISGRRSGDNGEVRVCERDDVLAWVSRREKAGKTRDEIEQESIAGVHDWPLPGKKLPRNDVDTARAILRDRKRRGDTARRRQPSESGKRLRQLHEQKRNGRSTGDLWQLQKAVAEAVGLLEFFDLPKLDWSEENELLVLEIYDDLWRHARWNDAAVDAVSTHMDELGQQRKISILRTRADDPSSTQSERATAARLAERLIKKRNAQRLSG